MNNKVEFILTTKSEGMKGKTMYLVMAVFFLLFGVFYAVNSEIVEDSDLFRRNEADMK